VEERSLEVESLNQLVLAAISIKSQEHSTRSSIKSLFEFLSDFKNFKDLLPEDKVENFRVEGDTCSFNVRGITPLRVKIIGTTPFSSIKYFLEGFSKYTFTLEAVFTGAPENTGQCRVEMHGDLNPFIKMMAEKPLEQLANTMSKRLAEMKL
jgi:carbon monoxide dehydrogenase subunit G